MENLDIHNAITTLNTIYFFECARKQGYSPKLLEDILMHSFNLTREKAIQIIYSAAPYYHQEGSEKKCDIYLIKYIQYRVRIK